jgi:tetratricopeptide (TPR) repeat protein
MKKLPFILFILLLFNIPAFAQADVKANVNDAKTVSKAQKYENLIAEITGAIQIQPNDAYLYLKRGEIYYEWGYHNPELVKDLLTAVSLAPNDENVLFAAAEKLRLTGRLQETLDITDRLIALKPSNFAVFNAYRLRFESKFYLNDYAGAFDEFMRLLELMPAHEIKIPAEQVFILTAGSGSNFGRLKELFDKLKNDDNVFVYYERLFAQFEKKSREIDELETEKKLYGQRGMFVQLIVLTNLRTFYHKCAELYVEREQTGKAIELMERLVQAMPDWNVYEERARFYKKREMPAEAAADYRAAISDLSKELEEKEIDYLFIKRGDFYFELKEYKSALKDYQKALSFGGRIERGAVIKIDSAKKRIQEEENRQK